MLPNVAGREATSRQITLYAALLLAVSFVPVVLGELGVLYAAPAALLGGRFLWLAVDLMHAPDIPHARGRSASRCCTLPRSSRDGTRPRAARMSGPVASLDDVDLLDHDLFAEREPWDVFELLRRDAPVYWHDEPGGRGFWCVTRYDDVVAVLKDTATYSSELGGVAQIEDMQADELEARRNFMETDPPLHSQWRRLFARDFAPRSLARYEPFLRDLTRGLLDDVLPRGEFDFVEQIAVPDPDPRARPPARRARGAPRSARRARRRDARRHRPRARPRARRLGRARALPPRAVRQPGRRRALRDRPRHLRRAPRASAGRHPLARRPRRRSTAARSTSAQLDNTFAIMVVAGNETTRQAMALGMLGADAVPRPARAAAPERRRLAARGRRADPLRLARLVLPAHRHAGRRARGHARSAPATRSSSGSAPRTAIPQRFPDPDRLDLTRPRDVHASVRPGRPPLLPRSAPGAARADRAVPGAPAAHRLDRSSPGRSRACARTSGTASSACPCASTLSSVARASCCWASAAASRRRREQLRLHRLQVRERGLHRRELRLQRSARCCSVAVIASIEPAGPATARRPADRVRDRPVALDRVPRQVRDALHEPVRGARARRST